MTLSLLQENTLSLPPQYGVLFGARQQIRVECGFSLSLRVSLPLWVLGVGETSGSSFSRPAEGYSGETYGQRLQRTSNMADGELQIYQSLKTQQSSTCIPWICGILWRMATTRFQLNTLSISFLCTVC